VRKLPKHIIDKVHRQSKYAKLAHKNRIEIEEWFRKQGMTAYNDMGDCIIDDTLIDNETHYGVEETVQLLEGLLNDLEKKG
jgi:hypothetical protein